MESGCLKWQGKRASSFPGDLCGFSVVFCCAGFDSLLSLPWGTGSTKLGTASSSPAATSPPWTTSEQGATPWISPQCLSTIPNSSQRASPTCLHCPHLCPLPRTTPEWWTWLWTQWGNLELERPCTVLMALSKALGSGWCHPTASTGRWATQPSPQITTHKGLRDMPTGPWQSGASTHCSPMPAGEQGGSFPMKRLKENCKWEQICSGVLTLKPCL